MRMFGSRLECPDKAKAVIVRGLKSIPKSEKLWLRAAEMEHYDINRRKVLAECLENIPCTAVEECCEPSN